MNREITVIGNWKMHGSLASIEQLLTHIKQTYDDGCPVSCAVLPAFPYLAKVAGLLAGSKIAWGAQNMSAYEAGAYTGEVSAAMLRDFKCRFVLLGHSERRALYGEDDTVIALKFAQAVHYGLHPILCVGETLKQREQEQTDAVIKRQLHAILDLRDGVANLQHAMIAYEPVWAIGTGVAASPEQAQQVHEMIRAELATRDVDIAQKIPILYGGSVRHANAHSLFSMPDIDGGLVGGASLDAEEFLGIIQCIN